MNKEKKGSERSSEVPKLNRENDRMEIPSSLNYLARVDEFIERKLTKLGMSKGQIYDIAISVSEVVTNAVVHGNRNDDSKKVRISLKADASRVEVTVEDEGAGFDRGEVCSPLQEENLLKEAGRGLLIVESLMDEVNILCGPKGGTLVKIVKSLTSKK
jgi:serine/threonine-protein kinase RsbW